MRLEFTRVRFNYPSQVFLKKDSFSTLSASKTQVFFLADRKHENNHQEIGSHLNPWSFFIFSTISSFKASAKAWLIGNPFLAKSMAGLTRSSQLNLPCSFQAWYWPRTSPGTAIARPPGKKTLWIQHQPASKPSFVRRRERAVMARAPTKISPPKSSRGSFRARLICAGSLLFFFLFKHSRSKNLRGTRAEAPLFYH